MPTTRVEIPEISNRQLGYLARIIKPVVSLVMLPQGRWPQDEVRTFYLKMPKNLRGDNFLKQRCLGRVLLVEEKRIRTLHTPCSGGVVFHPTIAEVLAQIPERYINSRLPANQVVAFETFLEKYGPEYDESGRFHLATTVLLTQASPNTGELMRYHYS